MKITETHLKGCFVIEPTVFDDDRGVFFESYKKHELEEALGRSIDFVQDNHSVSKKGVLRGLHFQVGEHQQSKLVRVAKGEVLDVAVDLRKDSTTFGQHYKLRLSESNKKSLFVPKGMAHGFLVLSDEAIFVYKCDTYYRKEAERGVIFNDNTLAIDWGFPLDKLVLSEKDRELPSFKDMYP